MDTKQYVAQPQIQKYSKTAPIQENDVVCAVPPQFLAFLELRHGEAVPVGHKVNQQFFISEVYWRKHLDINQVKSIQKSLDRQRLKSA